MPSTLNNKFVGRRQLHRLNCRCSGFLYPSHGFIGNELCVVSLSINFCKFDRTGLRLKETRVTIITWVMPQPPLRLPLNIIAAIDVEVVGILWRWRFYNRLDDFVLFPWISFWLESQITVERFQLTSSYWNTEIFASENYLLESAFTYWMFVTPKTSPKG